MTPDERERRELVSEEVSKTHVPRVQSEVSAASKKPETGASKKVKKPMVAASPKGTLPRQQEHMQGRKAVHT